MSKVKRFSPLQMILGSLVSLLGAAVLMGYLWWQSTSDIEAALSKVKESGIELDILKVLPPQSAPERVEAYEKLVLLLDKSLTYGESPDYDRKNENVGCLSGKGKHYFPGRYDLSPAFLAHYKQQEIQDYLKKIGGLVHTIGFDPISFGERDEMAGGDLNAASYQYELAILWCEYAQDLPAPEFNHILVLLLRHLQINKEGEWLDALVCITIIGLVESVASSRIDEVNAELIAELNLSLVYSEQRLLKAVHYDLIELLNEWQQRFDAMQKFSRPENWYDALMWDFRVRVNRDEIIYNQLKLFKASRVDLDTFARQNEDLCGASISGTLRLSDDDWPDQKFMDYASLLGSMSKNKQCLLLIESWSADKTLPVDLLDPTGGRLLPIMDEGEMVGAYSVGENGTDDGWKGEDEGHVYWLYDDLSRNY